MADFTEETSLITGQPVQIKSSTISQVQYNAIDKTLTVTFKNGGSYQYSEVSAQEYQGLLDAPSAGSYFRSQIKGHSFKKL